MKQYINGYKWQGLLERETNDVVSSALSAPKAFLLTLLAPASFKSEWSSMLGSQVQLKKCFLGKYSIMYNLKRHKFLQMSPWWLKNEHYNWKKKQPSSMAATHLPWSGTHWRQFRCFRSIFGGCLALKLQFQPFAPGQNFWFLLLRSWKKQMSKCSGKKGRGICAKNKNHWFFKGWFDMFHHF